MRDLKKKMVIWAFTDKMLQNKKFMSYMKLRIEEIAMNLATLT